MPAPLAGILTWRFLNFHSFMCTLTTLNHVAYAISAVLWQLEKTLKNVLTTKKTTKMEDGPDIVGKQRYPNSACHVLVNRESFLSEDGGEPIYPMPGRSVCSTGNFVGFVKPEGWEFH